MQNIKIEILQRNRLRPQKNGRLPTLNICKGSQSDRNTDNLQQKIQFNLQSNKFGVDNRGYGHFEKNSKNLTQRVKQSLNQCQVRLQNKQEIIPKLIQQLENRQMEKIEKNNIPLLKYNQTRINPGKSCKTNRKMIDTYKINTSRDNQIYYKENFIPLNRSHTTPSCQLPHIYFNVPRKKQNRKDQYHSDILSINNKENLILKKYPKISKKQLVNTQKKLKFNIMRHIVSMGRREIDKIS